MIIDFFKHKILFIAAYKRADGKKIDGRRVVVDIERGRTIKGWKPRRLGGGKGGRKSHYDPMLIDRMPDGYGVGEVDRFDEKKPRDRERDRESNRDRHKRSKSRSKSRERKKRSKSKDRHRSRSRERAKKSRRSRSKEGKSKKRSRSREKNREKREKSMESDRYNGNGDGIANNVNGTPTNGTEYGEIV